MCQSSTFWKSTITNSVQFAPARPLREVRPRLLDSTRHPNVDVKVWIDDTGQVTGAELLSDDVEPEVADVASNMPLTSGALQPARLSGRPVSSEMVMHFISSLTSLLRATALSVELPRNTARLRRKLMDRR